MEELLIVVIILVILIATFIAISYGTKFARTLTGINKSGGVKDIDGRVILNPVIMRTIENLKKSIDDYNITKESLSNNADIAEAISQLSQKEIIEYVKNREFDDALVLSSELDNLCEYIQPHFDAAVVDVLVNPVLEPHYKRWETSMIAISTMVDWSINLFGIHVMLKEYDVEFIKTMEKYAGTRNRSLGNLSDVLDILQLQIEQIRDLQNSSNPSNLNNINNIEGLDDLRNALMVILPPLHVQICDTIDNNALFKLIEMVEKCLIVINSTEVAPDRKNEDGNPMHIISLEASLRPVIRKYVRNYSDDMRKMNLASKSANLLCRIYDKYVVDLTQVMQDIDDFDGMWLNASVPGLRDIIVADIKNEIKIKLDKCVKTHKMYLAYKNTIDRLLPNLRAKYVPLLDASTIKPSSKCFMPASNVGGELIAPDIVENKINIMTHKRYLDFLQDYPMLIYNMYMQPSIENCRYVGQFINNIKHDIEKIKLYVDNFSKIVFDDFGDDDEVAARIIINFLQSTIVPQNVTSISIALDVSTLPQFNQVFVNTYNDLTNQNALDQANKTIDNIFNEYNRIVNSARDNNIITLSIVVILLKKKIEILNATLANPLCRQLVDMANLFTKYKNISKEQPITEINLRDANGNIIKKIGQVPELDCVNLRDTILVEMCDTLPDFMNVSDHMKRILKGIKNTKFAIQSAIDYYKGLIDRYQPQEPNLGFALNPDIKKCKLLRITSLLSNEQSDKFENYCVMFEDLPSIIHIVANKPSITGFLRLGHYLSYMDKAIRAGDINMQQFLSGIVPEMAPLLLVKQYKVLLNYINVAMNSYMLPMALAIINNFACINSKYMKEQQAETDKIKKEFQYIEQQFTKADTTLSLADMVAARDDIANKLPLISFNMTPNFETLQKKFIECVDKLNINSMNGIENTPNTAREPVVMITIDNVQHQLPQIGVLPNITITDEFREEIESTINDINKSRDDHRYLTEVAQNIAANNNRLNLLSTRITKATEAVRKRIAGAMDINYVVAAKVPEVVDDNTELEINIHKEKEEAEKKYEDKYKAKLDELSREQYETLYDRIGRMSNDSTNFIHFVMAKRIVSHTGDKSYDVSVTEMNNSNSVREKLVKFFTAQGIAGVNSTNINEKYAEWQKKNQFRLVHQSDIDDPSATILHFS